eukprot:3018024-Rhodomonas_salina.1
MTASVTQTAASSIVYVSHAASVVTTLTELSPRATVLDVQLPSGQTAYVWRSAGDTPLLHRYDISDPFSPVEELVPNLPDASADSPSHALQVLTSTEAGLKVTLLANETLT